MTDLSHPPRIVILTAGAGGMYCGSCLQDNTLARALTEMGVDVQLIPTYTPIRTDEENVSTDQVLMGGINVYLQQILPLFRYTPRFLDRVFDHPKLLRWAADRGVKTTAADLGPLTVSMLKGDLGNQRKEVLRLCRWLRDVKPSLINLSNILIGGCVPAIKRELHIPVFVTLQGDDIFLNGLLPRYRDQALQEIKRIAPKVDGFITHSRYYADHMSELLSLDRRKIHVVPLGVNLSQWTAASANQNTRPKDQGDSLPNVAVESGRTQTSTARPPTIGYLARLAPEKGLHLICDAFEKLRRQPETSNVQLRIAGWLGGQHQEFVDDCFTKLDDAGLADSFSYCGEIDREGKREFLHSIDVLSVPSPYQEPKGIYVLEAFACGVPVVQPRHGAFPELIESTGGGLLFHPDNIDDLVKTLTTVLTNTELRQKLSASAVKNVERYHSSAAMAHSIADIMKTYLGRPLL